MNTKFFVELRISHYDMVGNTITMMSAGESGIPIIDCIMRAGDNGPTVSPLDTDWGDGTLFNGKICKSLFMSRWSTYYTY
jgi:hypothetical protein